MYLFQKGFIFVLSALCFLVFISFPIFSQTEIYERGLLNLEPFWRQALGGEVLSLPHVQAQSAVVTLDGGNIRAYSTAGNPMWNYSARGRISPFVTRSREGTSYITRTNGILIAVNRAGRELWRRDLESPLIAKPVIGWDGRLFVPTDKRIMCYTASGNLLWIKTFESSFTIVPKLDRGGGLLLAVENNVYRIDPFGNSHLWTLSDTPAFLFLTNQQQVMVIYPNGNMEILGTNQDWFIGAQSGVHVSLFPRLPARPLAATDRGNVIAVVLADGRVSLVSVDERKISWTGNSHIREIINSGGRAETEAEIVFDERGIYVLSRSGATGFSHEGRRLWYKFLQNTAAIPAFGDDGVLYSGGRDWILYAYKIEERTLNQRGSIYGLAPDGSYGMGRPLPAFSNDFPFFDDEIRSKLEQIGTAVNAGRVGSNEPRWTSFLLTLSTSQENIIYRIAALNLLGRLGSRDTIPWLIGIFNRENEPSVRTAAINAIGSIGVDPEGAALQTFMFSIIQGGGIREEQILVAIASATGALCRFSGPPLSETGIRILNLLSASNQPPVVRRQAQRELTSLR
jgi:outer membrane protein assembly factor BamB